jgi:hypothetical protein
VHFQQGIPCLLFDEFFTGAASWLGILYQRQEHGVRWRFSGAYLYCRGPASDVITFIFSPGVTGFLTLQTECGAKASISGSACSFFGLRQCLS